MTIRQWKRKPGPQSFRRLVAVETDRRGAAESPPTAARLRGPTMFGPTARRRGMPGWQLTGRTAPRARVRLSSPAGGGFPGAAGKSWQQVSDLGEMSDRPRVPSNDLDADGCAGSQLGDPGSPR